MIESENTPTVDERPGNRLSAFTSFLMWLIMIWGVPAIIMLIFALNGYLGRE